MGRKAVLRTELGGLEQQQGIGVLLVKYELDWMAGVSAVDWHIINKTQARPSLFTAHKLLTPGLDDSAILPLEKARL